MPTVVLAAPPTPGIPPTLAVAVAVVVPSLEAPPTVDIDPLSSVPAVLAPVVEPASSAL
jgi:hypothetical protein